MSKEQFMTENYGGFVHNKKDSHWQIAERISLFLNARDSSYYACFVGNTQYLKYLTKSHHFGQEKTLKDVLGRYMKNIYCI